MKKALQLCLCISAFGAFVERAHADERIGALRCPSRHGTGMVWFDPYGHRARLRLTGMGTFQGSYPIDVTLDCQFVTEGRRRWECLEAAPGAHPDGRHRLGIDISYGRYLPVAFRESSPGAWMVVDDFGCESEGGAR